MSATKENIVLPFLKNDKLSTSSCESAEEGSLTHVNEGDYSREPEFQD